MWCYLLSDADDDLVGLVAGEVDQLLQLGASVVVLAQRRLCGRHVPRHLFTRVRRLRALYQLVQLHTAATQLGNR